MSEENKIKEEEIIAFLLGELDKEREEQIKKVLNEKPILQEKKRMISGTLGLLEASSKDPIPALADQEWKLSEHRKNNIFSSGSAKEEEEEEEEEGKSPNLLFWIPLGVAACALLIVLASAPDKAGDIEVASETEKEIQETTSTSKIIVDEKADLNQMLLDRTQEGVTHELSARTTADIIRMKEELKEKEPPFLANAFTPTEALLYRADAAVISKKSDQKNNDTFAINSEDEPSRIDKSSNVEKRKKLTKVKTLPSMGFADGKINPPTPAKDKLQLQVEEQKLASKNVQSVTSYPEATELPVPEASIDKGAPVPASKLHIKAAGVQTAKKKEGNGYNLIDRSQSAFLFTPKAKALGRVKMIKREGQNIELLRQHETRLGKTILLSGKDYQLRFSFDNQPPIILVGNLERKEGVQEKENLNNQLSTYNFQIKESWILNEKEIRKPIDLNQTR